MADVYTDTSVTTNLVAAAYDKYVEFALRSEPLFRTCVDKRPVNVDKPGSSVVFQKYVDLAVATTALTESVDPDAVALSNTTTVSVTLNEYGNAVLVTEKLALESMSDIDPAIADIVAFNMRDSLDSLVRAVAIGGTNVLFSNSTTIDTTGPTNTITGSGDKFQALHSRYVVAKLRGASAQPVKDGLYAAYIHPDVSHDLRAATGGDQWRDPHNYSAPGSIWAGEIGAFEGAFYIETPRGYYANDGTTSAKVHRTLFMGKQALAEAVAREPGVVIGPVTDKLMRHRPIGWKGLLGWARFREDALWRVESSSTI